MIQTRPQHILLAEPDPQDALLVQLAFKQAGIENPIDTVKTHEQLIDHLTAGSQFTDRSGYPLPTAIILALPMPLTDDFKTLRWIRRQPALRNIPVSVLSGIDYPQEQAIAQQLGAQCYHVKPCAFSQLVRIAEEIAERCLGPLHQAA